jgi:hypothetical protein
MLHIFTEIYTADYAYHIKGIVWIYQFSRDYTDDQLYIRSWKIK